MYKLNNIHEDIKKVLVNTAATESFVNFPYAPHENIFNSFDFALKS